MIIPESSEVIPIISSSGNGKQHSEKCIATPGCKSFISKGILSIFFDLLYLEKNESLDVGFNFNNCLGFM